MTTCLDTETRNAVPISRGTDLYTRSAECLMLTYARDEAPVGFWDVIGCQPIPRDFADALRDPQEVLVAHNVAFDRPILTHALNLPTPITRWRCTMAQAYAHGLPGSLATLGAVLELPEDERKREDDSKLIHLFCIPRADGSWATRETHPDEWRRFCGYAVNDTVALREIYRRLPKHNYQGENLHSWWLDQLINDRGFGFDQELAIAARTMLSKAKDQHDTDITLATTGDVRSATQRAKLLKFLNDSGLQLPNMRAATMREWLEQDDLRPEHRFLLELRLEGARSAGSKYKRGMETVSPDSRLRYTIQWSGAGRTGRSAGRGFQPHNAARPTAKAAWIDQVVIPGVLSGAALDEPLIYGSANEACSNAVRGCIVPAPGNELVVGDWSNIEGRILAWCANEEWKLAAYRAQDAGTGEDGYKILYSRFFGAPIESVTGDQRQVGKVVDLSCGYLAGVGAFVTMAAGYNVDLDALTPLVLPNAKPEYLKKAHSAWRRAFLTGEDYGLEPDTYKACDVLKQVYRAANAKIFATGREVGDATIAAIENPGALFEVARCKIWSTGTWLIIQLPSGRRVLYSKPKIETEKQRDPETGKESVRRYITYMVARGKSWIRQRAWAGLFVENIVQAIANDVLRAGLRQVHASTRTLVVKGTAICLHVHDEIVLDVPRGSYSLLRLINNMTTELLSSVPWMHGLPLAAAGYTALRYRKG